MIKVNGESLAWQPGLTVAELIKSRGFTHPLLLVAINDHVIDNDLYGNAEINDDDVVQIIHLMTGG